MSFFSVSCVFLMYLLIYFLATWNVGCYFPDQGSNPSPLHYKHRVFNHWTTREVSVLHFKES